jgi:hypothetical protein
VGRAREITNAVKAHDRSLYCDRDKAGKLCIYRTSHRFETFWIDSNTSLCVARPAPFLIFTLTHNWSPQGIPVDWGTIPILERLKAHDLRQRDIVAEMEKDYDKQKASLARDSRNQAEAFAEEMRPRFKKAFADVNTSNMSKIERKQKDEAKLCQL